MKATLDDVTKVALSLSTNDKAMLAEKIIQSLVSHVPQVIKRQQLTEVFRRREEILSGKANGISLEQAIREIQALVP